MSLMEKLIMTEYIASNVVFTTKVKEAIGTTLELTDESGKPSYYVLEQEFDIAGKSYAVLVSDEPSSNQEPEIFQVVQNDEGQLELATIDDDDEWENISELYDELTFSE